MTASFIRSADGLVGIEYGHFQIESRGLFDPPRFDFTDGAVLVPGEDAFAVCTSNSFTHYALVHLEVWESAPDTPGIDEQVVVFTDPTISARAVMATSPETGTLDLGAPGAYRVRVHRWGGDRVEEAFRAFPDALIHRVEHFVLRLWPTDSPAPRPEPELDAFAEQNLALRQWARDL